MKIIENLIKGLSSVEGLLLPVDFNVFMASTFQARETAQRQLSFFAFIASTF